jgi:hypothetical protein
LRHFNAAASAQLRLRAASAIAHSYQPTRLTISQPARRLSHYTLQLLQPANPSQAIAISRHNRVQAQQQHAKRVVPNTTNVMGLTERHSI